MARKGKGFNIKRFFADHAEKMAFCVVLGLAVLALAGTNWVPYAKQPGEFTTKVDSAKQAISVTTWSDEDRAKFVLKEEELPRYIVDHGIHDRIQVTPQFLQSQPQYKNKDARDDPLSEPVLRPVVEMEVSSERVLIAQAPKYDDLASTEDGKEGDDTTTDAEATTEPEDDTPDEFRDRRGSAGGFATAADSFAGGIAPFGMGAATARDYSSMVAPELMGGLGADFGGAMGGGSRRGGRGSSRRGDRATGPATGADAMAPGRGRDRDRGRSSRRGRGAVEEGDEVFPFTGGATPMTAADEAGMGMGAMGGYAGAETDGKGYPFVSVRGVFEYREQIRNYSEAIHKSYAEALQYFMIIDFKMERQRLVNPPNEWSDWEPVNDQVFRDILKEAAGFDPEVVQAAVTDSAITCPLPSRLSGAYRDAATHKRLDEFKLSEEEIQRELEYNKLLLENVLEQNKLREAPVTKKGFADMVFDARTVQQSYFGSASPYAGAGLGMMGGGNGDEDIPTMMPGGPGGFGGPGSFGSGATAGRGQKRPDPMLSKSLDMLARELAERVDTADSPEATAELRKWIEARAVPQGDLLLFRYFDFDVEPGETYRYRIRLELQNPNYNVPLAATGGVASVREGETRLTPWSEPTPPITVERTVNYFLTTVQPPTSLVYPEARMNVFQYDQDVGTVVQQELEVAFGQNIGGKARVEQPDPGKGTLEEVDYTFKSDDILLDAIPDLRMSKTEHPDLQLPADSRGLAQISEYAAVLTRHGRIETIDQRSQASALTKARKYLEKQEEYFAHLRSPDGGPGGTYDTLYGYGGEDDMIDPMMMMMGGPQGRNPLRRGPSGAGGGRRGGGGDRR